LASNEPSSLGDKKYIAVLKSLPLDKLEEILVFIDESVKEYLREKLAKSSEYTLVAGISRTPGGVDLVVDLSVDRCITPRDKCIDIVNDALNYVKKRVEEYLESLYKTSHVNTA
jgi:hypothetical protein